MEQNLKAELFTGSTGIIGILIMRALYLGYNLESLDIAMILGMIGLAFTCFVFIIKEKEIIEKKN